MFNYVVKCFRLNGSNLFCCSLNAIKVFNRLNRFYLLSCLNDKGVPLCIVNLYVSWYRNLSAYVKCGNHVLFTCFTIWLGTPQSSLLIGKFFNFVIYKLLTHVEDAQIGCHINGLFAGAIAYTDDIMLLSASLVQMIAMLKVLINLVFYVILRLIVLNHYGV